MPTCWIDHWVLAASLYQATFLQTTSVQAYSLHMTAPFGPAKPVSDHALSALWLAFQPPSSGTGAAVAGDQAGPSDADAAAPINSTAPRTGAFFSLW